MKRSYLEITYRHGKPFAAYYYLPRHASDHSAKVEVVDSTYNIDYAVDGRPIGIEIIQPGSVTTANLNAILLRLAVAPAAPADLLPLAAA